MNEKRKNEEECELKALVNICLVWKISAVCPYMLSEYLMGWTNGPVKKIIVQGYHLVLQNSENLKDHLVHYYTEWVKKKITLRK